MGPCGNGHPRGCLFGHCSVGSARTKHLELRGEEKYYLADLGIYHARNTDARVSYGPSLENVLYVYLRSRGYRVSVGRIGKLECDFICRRRDDYSYVQVAMTIADRAVEDREYRPFAYIRDNYP